MRTFLICHEDEPINRIVLPRWLASFSDVTGVLILREESGRKWKRIRREMKRVGLFRFADVLAFRAYYGFFLAARDAAWEQAAIYRLSQNYPEPAVPMPTLTTASPNSTEAREFIRRAAPDIMIVRCKTLLKEDIFTIPKRGTFVMHPGICPEYRNAHGCFWALANRDTDRVGMTLLRIDKGVDTGPTYGYFHADYDEKNESHIIIQLRTVFDNLDAIRDKLLEVASGTAQPLSTDGRKSAAWGQPWLTKYLAWKRSAGGAA